MVRELEIDNRFFLFWRIFFQNKNENLRQNTMEDYIIVFSQLISPHHVYKAVLFP